MKAVIDRDGCISCGLCAETCPDVFQMAEDGLAVVMTEEVPADALDLATQAKDGCPVEVITLQ